MTPTKTRWYARANEASFEPTEGGYVFQAPSPWVSPGPAITWRVPRKKKRFLLTWLAGGSCCSCPCSASSPSPLPVIASHRYCRLRIDSSAPASFLCLYSRHLHCDGAASPAQIYLARALRPLLADAPRTEERIKVAEQLPVIATAVSTQWLVIGLVSAVAMMVAAAF